MEAGMAIRNVPDRSSTPGARRSRIVPYPGVALPDDSMSGDKVDGRRLLITTATDEANLAQGWWRSRVGLMREIVNDARRDEVLSVAASMAYTTLFALIPLLLFLTALSGFVSDWLGTEDVVNRVTVWLFLHLPLSTAAAVRDPIQEALKNQASGLLSISAVLAIWFGKSAIAAAIGAVNKAYGRRDTRNWFVRTAIAIVLTLALGVGFVLGSTALLFGSRWGADVAEWIGAEQVFPEIWSVARWPIIAVLVLFGLTVFFWVAPDNEAPFRFALPGALFTLAGWTAATFGFAYYFTVAGSYSTAYGTLGGVLVFVFWLYVMSFVVIIGGEINAVIDHHRCRDIAPATGIPVRQ
jgi:membrane protein